FRRVSGIYAVLGLAILAQAATGRLGSPVAVVPIVLGCLAWLVVGRAERAATPLRAWVVVMLVAAITAVVELAVGMPSVAGNEHAFYALKARITTPIGDHNELASGLLVAVAVAAASRRARLV